ncbi:hypothetical protein [Roseimaritima sediminicola]|uniref:hypothetical protein n=1 Tax=Roseimaritima sediminicola TaxID=2662066 RepID=UPI0012982BAB|nr:hypothetical protein [Roseimaritima sediminicola]
MMTRIATPPLVQSGLCRGARWSRLGRFGTVVLGIAVCWPAIVARAAEEGASGQDRVAYLPAENAAAGSEAEHRDWRNRPLQVVTGSIQNWNEKHLQIQSAGGQDVTALRSEAVVWVLPHWSDADARAGARAYAEGQLAEAIAKMLAAIKKRPRSWQQEALSVRLAVAAFEAGRYPAAFELIAQLDRGDLPAVLVGQLPIVWSGRSRDAGLIAAAKARLDAPQPLLRLAAASALLSTSEAAAARRTLEDLAGDGTRPIVAKLADAQLWRTATPVETKQSASRWQEKCEAMPPAVTSGPWAAIAERLQTAGETEAALEYWLAVAMLSPDPDHPAAQRARRVAAQLLKQQGRSDEAARLQR